MIVCHCMGITDKDIRSAIDWMRASDPETIVTPGKIYRALGKRADCGGCMPHFLDTMRKCDSFEVPVNLRDLRRATNAGMNGNAG
ncbi:(2Fe-2S)-binding protein [Cereibacter azotoformans]|uniref:BFD-like [2Fe-2S] binding protein n=2 Tax=Cereibacter TaxID=1653176 RepID=A0A2T5K332_9RHOB|nr:MULTISPECIES: (2Fe-2S)-binding protein [Cereibacter]AXQ95149.1 (2Fe-2S)-binding protein [Cereibacter sphaeroides]MBO4170556.1 (2Fe-2S)-binding protein [Cereibacter azotoformans]PTR16825.1 BFD-like [2Fe-2S] binding protein [Cereibacter azotoformans]UIJ30156.1 (2Fe-2S)-binding protein [Cereibacter azotoformans]ULB10814.1 (2Fe-2S)-binding protein [Cereibacter azotoformans]